MAKDRDRPASFSEVFAVGEFRALWGAQGLSALGDQLARVALVVLVFERTSSAALAALTYALTLLPALVSGPLLSGLADRYPRREVMVVADLARTALLAVMAIPGMPLLVVAALLVVVTMIEAPFNAARAATLPDVLAGDRYVVGLGIANITRQSALLVGFAGGGVVVAVIGPHWALALDAVTFAVSAALVRWGLRSRPASRQSRPGESSSWFGSVGQSISLIWSDRRLRSVVGLAWLAGFYVVPEGIAAPYAAGLGGGAAAVGLLMAADPTGKVIGAFVLTRWIPPSVRPRLIGPLAVFAGVPLVLTILRPGIAASFVLWTVSGAFTAYQITANAAFVRIVPESQRGQALGLAASGLLAVQGLGIALAGVIADLLNPTTTVALAGLAGLIAATFGGIAWSRATSASATPAETGTPPARPAAPTRSCQSFDSPPTSPPAVSTHDSAPENT